MADDGFIGAVTSHGLNVQFAVQGNLEGENMLAGLLAYCNLVRRTEKGRLRRRGWGLRWEKAQKGGKGTNLRGFFED